MPSSRTQGDQGPPAAKTLSRQALCKGNPRHACRRDNHHNARPGRVRARPMEPRQKLTWLHRHIKGSLLSNQEPTTQSKRLHRCSKSVPEAFLTMPARRNPARQNQGQAARRPCCLSPKGRSAPNPHHINRRPFAWSGQALLWDLVSLVGLVGLCVGC